LRRYRPACGKLPCRPRLFASCGDRMPPAGDECSKSVHFAVMKSS
jgi:hypothetical protein